MACRTRSAALMTSFVLLVSVATAHAECAWVLWEETRILSHSKQSLFKEYEITQASSSPQECQQVLANAVQNRSARVRPGPKGELKVEGPVVIIRDPDGFTSWAYTCLPDTVDPRGPKGK